MNSLNNISEEINLKTPIIPKLKVKIVPILPQPGLVYIYNSYPVEYLIYDDRLLIKGALYDYNWDTTFINTVSKLQNSLEYNISDISDI